MDSAAGYLRGGLPPRQAPWSVSPADYLFACLRLLPLVDRVEHLVRREHLGLPDDGERVRLVEHGFADHEVAGELVVFLPQRRLPAGGVDRQPFEGRDDLVGVERTGLLDRLGEEVDAVIPFGRPCARVILVVGLVRLHELLVPLAVRPVEVVPLVDDHPRGHILAERLGDGDVPAGGDDPLHLVEHAVRLRLLDEGDQVAAPEGAEHGVGLRLEDGVDVGGVVGGEELGPLLPDELRLRVRFLRLRLEEVPHRPAVLVVRPDVVELRQVLVLRGRVQRQGVGFLRVAGPGAERVPVPLLLGQGVGGAHGVHEDHLLLLGDLGDREGPRRAHHAEQEVHLVLLDVPLGQGTEFLDVRLVVGHQQLELLPEDAALRVDLLDRELRSLLARDPEVRGATR